MSKYIVRYYDRFPLDPKDRYEIRREIVNADSEQGAGDIMAYCGKEVIDVEPYETVTDLAHAAYMEAAEPADEAERQAAEVASYDGWKDEAEADHAEWMDEQATRESVRP